MRLLPTAALCTAAGCVGILGCDGADDSVAVRFVDVDPAVRVDGALVVEASAPADARAQLLDELDARQGSPVLLGRGAWRTRVAIRGDERLEAEPLRGRTYVVR